MISNVLFEGPEQEERLSGQKEEPGQEPGGAGGSRGQGEPEVWRTEDVQTGQTGAVPQGETGRTGETQEEDTPGALQVNIALSGLY